MKSRLLLAAAISAALACPLYAQTTAPAADATVSGNTNLDQIHLRSLQAVLDARERRQDWHEAAQQAETPIQDPVLKDQLTQRLSGLAPRVAKELAAHPQDDALVSVDVFRDPGADGKQAMVSVTFEGMGTNIGSEYFANVLAGQSKPPQAEGVPANLVPDPEASSYLVFFFGNHALEAGDVPQPKMRQSLIAAINKQHEAAAHQDQLAQQQQKLQEQQANLQQQESDQAQLAANQQAANQQQQVIPEYPYGVGGAAPNGDDDGYYYPGIGVPIVITPNGYANTPQWRERERKREESLEKTYHNRKDVNRSASGQPAQSPAQGTQVPPGSVGVRQPSGQAGTRQPAGQSGARQPASSAGAREAPAQNGTHSSAGQGSTQHQAPAPAPHESGGSGGGGHAAGGSSGSGEKK